MKLTGAQILVRTLIEQGIELVFGYPGGAALNVYDALYEAKDQIRHVLSCHEQGAAHAADGYARASGKTGVVFATSGPGASNLVTGIATAHMDSVPMLAVTSNVASTLIGKDSFQELDIVGITLPITKHNFIVRDASKLADTVRQALVIARSGRPGPVLIDIPKDVTALIAEYEPKTPGSARPSPRLNDEDIEKAARLIAKAKKPLILAGGGVVSSGASAQLEALAERMDAPVCLTMPGITALPWNHPRNLGMIGMHGTQVSNRAGGRMRSAAFRGNTFFRPGNRRTENLRSQRGEDTD
jgi:acetolactate synthase-1/2/3 large subunit